MHRALATHARTDAKGREQPTIDDDPGRKDQQDNLPIEHWKPFSTNGTIELLTRPVFLHWGAYASTIAPRAPVSYGAIANVRP